MIDLQKKKSTRWLAGALDVYDGYARKVGSLLRLAGFGNSFYRIKGNRARPRFAKEVSERLVF